MHSSKVSESRDLFTISAHRNANRRPLLSCGVPNLGLHRTAHLRKAITKLSGVKPKPSRCKRNCPRGKLHSNPEGSGHVQGMKDPGFTGGGRGRRILGQRALDVSRPHVFIKLLTQSSAQEMGLAHRGIPNLGRKEPYRRPQAHQDHLVQVVVVILDIKSMTPACSRLLTRHPPRLWP